MNMTASTIMSMGADTSTGQPYRPVRVAAPVAPAGDLADGMLTHYLSQARSAEQVRRIKEFEGEDFIVVSGPAW